MMQRKRKKIIAGIAFSLAALLLVGGAAFGIRSEFFWRMKEKIRRVFSRVEIPLAENVETEEYPLSVLLADARVTFDQSGMLVNSDHRLAEGFSADLSEYKSTGVTMNSCMTDAYAALSAAVTEKFGETLLIRSAYRTAEEQAQAIAEEGEAATEVGASEHQTGLALDVYVPRFAGRAFLKSDVGKWVNTECWRYGFVIRYPDYGKSETGIGFEPWHLRYVGSPHAEAITKSGLTLESYFDLLADGEYRAFGGALISRQSGDTIKLPKDFSTATVSPDNAGGYLVTVRMPE